MCEITGMGKIISKFKSSSVEFPSIGFVVERLHCYINYTKGYENEKINDSNAVSLLSFFYDKRNDICRVVFIPERIHSSFSE